MSFASPPVDSTIPAASYPSSPESTRSPPWQYAAPATPNYRTAFQSDPFDGLGKALGDDQALQQAQVNAQNSAGGVQTQSYRSEDQVHNVRDTLSRFATIPSRQQTQQEAVTPFPPEAATRKSLDVDAFKRLLLTGERDSTAGIGTAADSIISNSNSYGSDATSYTPSQEDNRLSSQNYSRDTTEQSVKVPPPAPAPRRGKSVKLKEDRAIANDDISTIFVPAEASAASKPPGPPTSLRQNAQAPDSPHSEASDMPGKSKKPPPPPMRRQHSTTQRRPSTELPTTAEEHDLSATASLSSRRSSHERPPAPSSRNSSLSIKRQSLGLSNPPPLPPPRRGPGSSRTSMDSFIPSLSDIVADDDNQENVPPTSGFRETQRPPEPSSAGDILAELAHLQKEVDAARRAGDYG